MTEVRAPASVPRLSVSGIGKAYPGTQALRDIDLEILPGEIHGIAGQNGAGKSTLIKILSGAERPDQGRIAVDGAVVQLDTPQSAHRARIYTVHQELSLMSTLSVAENIFIDDLPRTRWGAVAWRTLRQRAREDLKRLGYDIDVRKPVGTLPIAHRQAVEISKAVGRDARVVLLDEPTATLPRHDVKGLFDVLRRLQQDNISIIYVSHHFDEMYEICDRISVFRDGHKVGVFAAEQSSHDAVLKAMLGGNSAETRSRMKLGDSGVPRFGTGGETEKEALSVSDLRDDSVLNGVDLTLGVGEVVGLSGLAGNGQRELAEALFGARRSSCERFMVNGRATKPKDPAHAIRLGMGLLPEERKTQGLVLDMSVAKNISMAALPKFTRYAFLRRGSEAAAARQMRQKLAIKSQSVKQPVVNLSGGNQQKVAIGKWLLSGAKILIFIEPTRGVDVAAKLEIHQLIKNFARDGGTVLVVTSEIDEALMCDRVAVMRRGRIVATVGRNEIEEHGEAAVLNRFS